MTDGRTPEYRTLELDTSNDLMDHDGDRGLRRYEKAARYVRHGGAGRVRMGRLMADAGEFVHAAEDWLSAAAFFLLATDRRRMRDALARAQELERQGKIPPENRHIFAALREREGELADLERRLAAFDAEYARLAAAGDDAAILGRLLDEVRDLPGLPRLHERVALHADRVGRADLAREHRDWAAVFAADEPADRPGDVPHPGPVGLPPRGRNGHHAPASPADLPAAGPV